MTDFAHRCSGCGLRWMTTQPGSVAAELCGDCWRKVQPILHALPAARPEPPAAEALIEKAFKAGYHCLWIRAEARYIFDAEMKPGDPDGAYQAWRAAVHAQEGPRDEG